MRAFKFRQKFSKQNEIAQIQETDNTKKQTKQKSTNSSLNFSAAPQDQIMQTSSRIQFNKIKQKVCMDEIEDQQSKSSSFTLEQSRNFDVNSILFRSIIIRNLVEFKELLDLSQSEYTLKLIFRASDHNFDVERFHKVCKDLRPTVTVAEISNGIIVGGYTPLPWSDKFDSVRTHYKTDVTNQSFLFNFTTKQKFFMTKLHSNKAIVGCKYLGPTFGGGYDFSIGNFANKKYSSTCDFPTSYRTQKQGINAKTSRKLFLGTSQQLFLIKQWEVFEVCCSFQSSKKKKTQHIQPLIQKNIYIPSIFQKFMRNFF